MRAEEVRPPAGRTSAAGDHLAGLGVGARVRRDHAAHRRVVQLGRERRSRWHLEKREKAVEVVGRRVHEVPVEAQRLPRLRQRPEDRPGHDGAHRMELELERGHDAEVPARRRAAPRTDRVPSSALAVTNLTVGQHDVGRDQVVEGESVLPRQVADPAAERQTGDPGRRDDPARRGEAERVGRVVEIAPGAPALDARGALLGIDVNPLHRGQVHHQPVVADRAAGDVVAAAADRDRQSLPAREVDRRDHVGHAGAPGDQRRPPVDHPVPDLARLVVARLVRPDQPPAQARPERRHGPLVEGRGPRRISHHGIHAPPPCVCALWIIRTPDDQGRIPGSLCRTGDWQSVRPRWKRPIGIQVPHGNERVNALTLRGDSKKPQRATGVEALVPGAMPHVRG